MHLYQSTSILCPYCLRPVTQQLARIPVWPTSLLRVYYFIGQVAHRHDELVSAVSYCPHYLCWATLSLQLESYFLITIIVAYDYSSVLLILRSLYSKSQYHCIILTWHPVALHLHYYLVVTAQSCIRVFLLVFLFLHVCLIALQYGHRS
jgi:hypothetical protein